jgi:hypothetical protein
VEAVYAKYFVSTIQQVLSKGEADVAINPTNYYSQMNHPEYLSINKQELLAERQNVSWTRTALSSLFIFG